MKTNFCVLGLVCLLSIEASADKFIISDVSVPQSGTSALSIGYEFTTETDKVGFTLSMSLPEGLTLQKDEGGDPIYVKDNCINKLNVLFPSEGSVAAQPSSGTATIAGSSGTLLTLTLVADASIEVGTVLTIPVTKATFQQRVSGSVTDIDIDDFSFKVTIGEPKDDLIVLDETSTTAPEASEGEVSVKVKRTIKAGQWSTLCLPFAMTGEQLIAAFGENVQLADFTTYDADYDDDDNVTALTVNFDELDVADGLEANYPCLIKTDNDITEFQLTATVEPDEENAVIEYDNGKTGKRREVYGSLIGTYTAQTAVPENCIFLSGNKFWYSVGTTKMKAYRAYFDFVEVLSDVDPAGVKFSFFLNGETTKVEGINTENTENMIFDLAGRKVNKPQHRGVYIINGKKTMIK